MGGLAVGDLSREGVAPPGAVACRAITAVGIHTDFGDVS